VLEALGGRNYMESLSDYTTKTEYDYMGNPIKTYRADGAYTTAVYNKQGQAVSTTDYLGNTTTAKYDQLGRVIKTETPFDGSTNTKTLTFYDNNGNITETREQNNEIGRTEHYKVTKYEYDSRNRLVCEQVNDGERDIYTQYAYDNVGNLVKTVTGQTSKLSNLYGTLPAEAASNTYEYDRFGNVIKHIDAMGQSETAQYNLMKLPITQTDRNGNTTTNTYNAYGSLLTSKVGTDVITNTYSANNLLISASNGQSGGDVSYTYDAYGNMASETTNGVTNTYTYDADGNRKSFTQKEGTNTIQNASYTYNSINRLTDVSFGNGINASYTYDANGRLKQENRGVVKSTYSYNKAGLVTGMSNTKGDSYSYKYRLDGNQLQKDNGDNRTTYTYNDMGQLLCEYDNNIDYTYEYDTRGNRLSKVDYNHDRAIDYTYDKNNRLLNESLRDEGEISGKKTYEYDKNGNLLFKAKEEYGNSLGAENIEITSVGNGITDYVQYYSYNMLNQLTGIQSESKVVSYTYDAAGRRSSKTVNGQTTNHLWDGSNIVCESGAEQGTYYRGINMIAQNAGGSISYYVYNAHGDTTSLLNSSGSVLKTYNNDSFGNNIENATSGASTPFRYNGQYTDIDTGLIYLRNRYYDPSIGRFTQEDPAKDGLNWYVYCANDPVNMVDPQGLAPGYWYKANALLDTSVQHTEQEERNMDSAIQAYKDGFLTEEQLSKNIVQNGGIIPRVGYEVEGNSVNIVMRCQFTGDRCNETFPGTNMTYKEAYISGVQSYWSGVAGDISINFKVSEFDSSYCRVATVKLLSFEAMVEEIGTGRGLNGYTSLVKGSEIYIVDNDLHSSSGRKRFDDLDRYQYDCIHETGHMLGLADLHGTGKYSAQVDSVMWGNANYGVKDKSLDMFMLYTAVIEGYTASGNYLEYSNYPKIMDQFVPDWRRNK